MILSPAAAVVGSSWTGIWVLAEVLKSVYAYTFQSLDPWLSAIDWIKSPFEVPMPTHREASPALLLGVLGRTRVEVASRIQEPLPTGPVEKAGPMAASTEVNAAAANAVMIWREEGISYGSG